MGTPGNCPVGYNTVERGGGWHKKIRSDLSGSNVVVRVYMLHPPGTNVRDVPTSVSYFGFGIVHNTCLALGC